MSAVGATHGVLFDIDGTLVDSVYQHVRIWHAILNERGLHVPQVMIHRGIGLAADRMLPWLLGRASADDAEMSAEHDRRFVKQANTLLPTPGAMALIADLEARQVPYLAVTSASEETQKALFEALGRRLPMPTLHGSGGKPHANVLLAAAQTLKLDPAHLTMIGDAVWDGEAARRSGMHFIGLRCGGTADEPLRQAGALWVEDSPRDLIGRL
jgi:HAD superfamily hydrolase (TIGR01509 family)